MWWTKVYEDHQIYFVLLLFCSNLYTAYNDFMWNEIKKNINVISQWIQYQHKERDKNNFF